MFLIKNLAPRTQLRRIFFLSLIIALLAALLIVIPNRSRPAFAAVEDLDAQGTGFPCSSSEGRGGIPYHHVWGSSKSDLIQDENIPATEGIQWQLGGYDSTTKSYSVEGTWSPKKNGGLTDENGNVLIHADEFEKKKWIEQINGQVMDPYGNVYVTIMSTGDHPDHGSDVYYVQLLPPSNKKTELGTMRVIAKLGQTTDKDGNIVNATDINGGTYIEEDGVPYALVSNNFLGGKGVYKIPLIRPDGAAIPTISEQTGWSGGPPKDYSWVKEGITYNGTEYTLVALEQTGNQKGTIWLGNTSGEVAKIKDVAIPTNFKVGGKKEEFGASYNYKFEDEKIMFWKWASSTILGIVTKK